MPLLLNAILSPAFQVIRYFVPIAQVLMTITFHCVFTASFTLSIYLGGFSLCSSAFISLLFLSPSPPPFSLSPSFPPFYFGHLVSLPPLSFTSWPVSLLVLVGWQLERRKLNAYHHGTSERRNRWSCDWSLHRCPVPSWYFQFMLKCCKKTLWLAFSSLSIIVLGIFLLFPIILQDLANPPVAFPYCPRQPFPIPAYYQKISRKYNQGTCVDDRILVWLFNILN